MTTTTTDTSFATPRPSFFARIGGYFVAYVDRQSRSDRINALRALSDAELARRGLTRDGIVAHVFADRLYL